MLIYQRVNYMDIIWIFCSREIPKTRKSSNVWPVFRAEAWPSPRLAPKSCSAKLLCLACWLCDLHTKKKTWRNSEWLRNVWSLECPFYLNSVHDQSSQNFPIPSSLLNQSCSKKSRCNHPRLHIPWMIRRPTGRECSILCHWIQVTQTATSDPAPRSAGSASTLEGREWHTHVFQGELGLQSPQPQKSHHKVTTHGRPLAWDSARWFHWKALQKKCICKMLKKNTETLVLKPRSGWREHLEEPRANLEVTTMVSTENGPLKPINPILWMVSFFSFHPSLESAESSTPMSPQQVSMRRLRQNLGEAEVEVSKVIGGTPSELRMLYFMKIPIYNWMTGGYPFQETFIWFW